MTPKETKRFIKDKFDSFNTKQDTLDKDIKHFSKKKIIVLDDDPKYLFTIHKMLTDRGENVITTNDPVKFIKLVALNNIKAVLIDYKLPNTTGIEILGTLNFLKCRKIICSGHRQDEVELPDEVPFYSKGEDIEKLIDLLGE